MIELSLVKAIDYMLPGIPKALQYFQSLLVDVVRIKVLGDRAVIHVGELTPVGPLVEKQVLNIHHVDVSDLLHCRLVIIHGILATLSDLTIVYLERIKVALLPLET